MKITWQFLFAHPAHFFALGFGSGLSPKAPGTAGTIASIPIWLWLAEQSMLFQSVFFGGDFFYWYLFLP